MAKKQRSEYSKSISFGRVIGYNHITKLLLFLSGPQLENPYDR